MTLKERESPTMPFAVEPRVNQPARWCLPELVCEVRYAEVTREGTLRHPTYRGLRGDVDPKECTGEERRESTKRAIRESARAAARRDGGEVASPKARVPSVLHIEGHDIRPWLARVDDPEHPDIAIIDLDPATGNWDDVKEAAGVVHEILDAMDLRGFPKTTGSRGIHVWVPIARRYTFEESRNFVLDVGKAARERAPKLITVEVVKERRRGIYIDFLQNVGGKTTAGPYSVRPIRRAPVSAPLRWDEIGALGRPDAFTIANMSARLEAVGDLLAPAMGLEQKLPARARAR